jgi:hypothetical protein
MRPLNLVEGVMDLLKAFAGRPMKAFKVLSSLLVPLFAKEFSDHLIILIRRQKVFWMQFKGS